MTEKFIFKDAKKSDFNGQMEFRKRSNVHLNRSYYPSSEDRCVVHYLFFEVFCEHMRETGRHHILTTHVEPDPVALGVVRLERLGCLHKKVGMNGGAQITPEILRASLTPKTGLFSLSLNCDFTGIVQPVQELGDVCREQGVLFHVHVAPGSLSFEELSADYVTCKGKLWAREPFTSKEFSFYRMDSLDVQEGCMEVSRLQSRLKKGIEENFLEAIECFSGAEKLPGYLVMSFFGVSSQALIYLLQSKGVHVRSNAKLFRLLGVDPLIAQCAVSFVITDETTESQIDYAIEVICACAKNLRKCSLGLI